MPHKAITFRSQTAGEMSDFIADEGLVCQASQTILSYLAGALLNYREEGVELSPTILFCQQAQTFLESLPGCVRYQIGTAPLEADSAKRLLKESATLAVDGWHIWIERTDDHNLAYGVFSYLVLPTTLPLGETIGLMTGGFAVLLRRSSRSTIEIRGSRGNSLALVFSTSREDSPAGDPVSQFSGKCCHDVPESDAAGFIAYFGQMIARVLEASHGTILLCGTVASTLTAEGVSDSVALDPPLDFLTAFRDYQNLEFGRFNSETSSVGSAFTRLREI